MTCFSQALALGQLHGQSCCRSSQVSSRRSFCGNDWNHPDVRRSGYRTKKSVSILRALRGSILLAGATCRSADGATVMSLRGRRHVRRIEGSQCLKVRPLSAPCALESAVEAVRVVRGVLGRWFGTSRLGGCRHHLPPTGTTMWWVSEIGRHEEKFYRGKTLAEGHEPVFMNAF
jgi:hypothetical protein